MKYDKYQKLIKQLDRVHFAQLARQIQANEKHFKYNRNQLNEAMYMHSITTLEFDRLRLEAAQKILRGEDEIKVLAEYRPQFENLQKQIEFYSQIIEKLPFDVVVEKEVHETAWQYMNLPTMSGGLVN